MSKSKRNKLMYLIISLGILGINFILGIFSIDKISIIKLIYVLIVIMWIALFFHKSAIIKRNKILGHYYFFSGKIYSVLDQELTGYKTIYEYDNKLEHNKNSSYGKNNYFRIIFQIILSFVLLLFVIKNREYIFFFSDVFKSIAYVLIILFSYKISKNYDNLIKYICYGIVFLIGIITMEATLIGTISNVMLFIIIIAFINEIFTRIFKCELIMSILLTFSLTMVSANIILIIAEKNSILDFYVSIISVCSALVIMVLQIIVLSQDIPFYIIRNIQGEKIGYYKVSTDEITKKMSIELEEYIYYSEYLLSINKNGGEK